MYKIDKTLYDNKVTRKYIVKLKKLEEGEKPAIVSDTMFKTMFQTLSEASHNKHMAKKNMLII